MKADSVLLLTLVNLLVGAPAAAQPPCLLPPSRRGSDAGIGFVDLGQVFALSRDGKAMVARIDEVRAKLQTGLDARGKEVLTLETHLAHEANARRSASVRTGHV